MKQIILIIPILLSSVTVSGMQQPAKKYSEAASKKLMTALRTAFPKDQLINKIINALNEGADPNYAELFTFPSPRPIRGSLVALDIDEIEEMERRYRRSGKTTSLTPLYQAINLGDRDIISILLKAGANPNLRNILDQGSIEAGNNMLKTAQEFAQEKGVELTIIPNLKLK